MHSLHRLRGDSTGNVDFLLGILHFKRKAPDDAGDSAAQFSPGKVLANTRPLAMEEGDLGKVGRCPAVVVGHSIPVLVGVDPALRHKLVAIVAPEDGAAIDSVRAENDARSLGNMFPGDDGVTKGLANGDGDRREETKHLLADAIQQRERFQIGMGDGAVARGDLLADLRSQALLDLRVQSQKIAGPGEGTGGCFVLSVVFGQHLRRSFYLSKS